MSRPNVLIVMADQVNGTLFENGPADFLHVPHLRSWYNSAVNFSHCYTSSPLCGPARASLMTGRLPSSSGVYDNAAELAASMPSFAHQLRRNGYNTVLSGKMHFVGPDQLHGFEERLTTDVYPSDFGWTPDYRKPNERVDWWYHNMGSVTGAGVAETSNQLEYDDEVAFVAEQKLRDFARGKDPRPWCMTVSFTHPHDPYVTRQEYWDLYENCPALMPNAPAVPYDQQDPHSKRLLDANDYKAFNISDENIRRSRRAYFGNISYIDDKFGGLLKILERTGMRDNTIILFLSDHGDMLGDHGLWFKMSPREGSSRVPLAIQIPGQKAETINEAVSTVDIANTLSELVGIDNIDDEFLSGDGVSLLPLIKKESHHGPVYMEYAAEGTVAPLVTICDGPYKFNWCDNDPPQLFNIETDPYEFRNLAKDSDYADIVQDFIERVRARWDLKKFDTEVRESQARRIFVYEALRKGRYTPWDHQPFFAASERYMRNHMDLNILEAQQRC